MATATPGFASPPAPAPPQRNPMETQVKVVAVLNIVAGALALVTSVFVFFAFAVGTVATEDATRRGAPDWVPGVVAGLGLILGILTALVGVAALAAGIALLGHRRSGKTVGILASVLHLLNLLFFPFSTALGVYGLVILLNRDTEALLVA